MILHASYNIRPGISFAVSHGASLPSNPKMPHTLAVKTVVRYIVKSLNCGIKVKPCVSYNLSRLVAADFAGLFNIEPSSNPAAAKSYLGHVITSACF